LTKKGVLLRRKSDVSGNQQIVKKLIENDKLRVASTSSQRRAR
jgi:hypothetical protein